MFDLAITPTVILLALGLGSLIFFAAAAVAPRRTVLMPDGSRRLEPSDLEKLLTPLGRRVGRRRKLHRVQQELEWARISRFSPELWVLLPFLAGPGIGLVILSLMLSSGGEVGTAVIAGVVGMVVGIIYPRTLLSGRLKARSKAIRRDVLPFMSQYARTATLAKDMTLTFDTMKNLVDAEQSQFESRLRLPSANRRQLQRRRTESPYASDLWLGLQLMMRHASSGLFRAAADYDRPDPLIAYAIFVDDRDFSRFIDKLRQARSHDRNFSPDQLDLEVTNLQARRIQEVEQSFAAMVAKGTLYLILFNMPLLLAVALAPVVGPLLSVFGSI